MSPMGGFSGQASEGLADLFSRDTFGFLERFPLHQFRQNGAAGDRGDATAGFEADRFNPAVGGADAQLQYVPAGRIADLCLRGRVGKVACIPGILEVIQYRGRVHAGILASGLHPRNRAGHYRLPRLGYDFAGGF